LKALQEVVAVLHEAEQGAVVEAVVDLVVVVAEEVVEAVEEALAVAVEAVVILHLKDHPNKFKNSQLFHMLVEISLF